jgi:multicomponent Na+:H+ antiporter subunit E
MFLISSTQGTAILRRALGLGFLWIILTAGAAPGSWIIGVPAVLLATLVSSYWRPRSPINLFELLRFLPVFLLRSLSAAFDIAWRAFVPRLPIEPALIAYDLSLPEGLARVAFMNTVSLLPGTLSAALDGARLSVHVLDDRRDHSAEIARLERTMAQIFPQTTHD